MKVLVACEFSGVVRDAFARRGHDAWSCDLLPTERPGNHLQCDVLTVLDDGWDLMIAHPPCTYLCSSGLHWNKRRPERESRTAEAMSFVLRLVGREHSIPKVALENPIGRISTAYRPPDQIIQPYQFGDDASKQTCLWLIGLPPLVATRYVEPRLVCCGRVVPEAAGKYGCPVCEGERAARPRWANQLNSGQNRLGPSAGRAAERARTYPGIAAAMAEQWGGYTGHAAGCRGRDR